MTASATTPEATASTQIRTATVSAITAALRQEPELGPAVAATISTITAMVFVIIGVQPEVALAVLAAVAAMSMIMETASATTMLPAMVMALGTAAPIAAVADTGADAEDKSIGTYDNLFNFCGN